jgi:tRNA-specific 2-thiouridylase
MSNKNEKEKVYVGLSGGVDSSVSALLLKQQGYDVTGVFIRGWQPDWIKCTWKDDRISAMRSAAHLDIPFITLDLEKEYKDKVVTYLLNEYSRGNTPNPDMLCNREIKFGIFLSWSIRHGADYVATGRYAQTEKSDLKESNDKEKDQSYFLAQLTSKELEHVLFPIGHLEKKEVRAIASENNLPVATRKDSQGICFVGDLEMSDFLKRELNPQKGKVLNTKGEEIGEHEGAVIYTVGQRHGFTITKNTENQKNLYIVSKDIDNNTITVGENFEKKSSNKDFIINNFSAVKNFNEIKKAKDLSVRIRYRGQKYKIKIEHIDEIKKEVIFSSKENLEFAHGQFAVIYSADKVLGSGEL